MKFIHKLRNRKQMKSVREWVNQKDDAQAIYSPIRGETDADAIAAMDESTFDVLIDGEETRVDGACTECGGYDCQHVDAVAAAVGNWGFCDCGALAVEDRLINGIHRYHCVDCGRRRNS